MLNTDFCIKTGLLTLSTQEGKSFAQIEWASGMGYVVSINPLCKNAYSACKMVKIAWLNLDAVKYHALALFLEHGAE